MLTVVQLSIEISCITLMGSSCRLQQLHWCIGPANNRYDDYYYYYYMMIMIVLIVVMKMKTLWCVQLHQYQQLNQSIIIIIIIIANHYTCHNLPSKLSLAVG